MVLNDGRTRLDVGMTGVHGHHLLPGSPVSVSESGMFTVTKPSVMYVLYEDGCPEYWDGAEGR